MENFESCFFKYSVDVKEMPLKKCHHPGLVATEAKNLWIIFCFPKADYYFGFESFSLSK
jgi:hypothetical protein